MTTAGGSPGRMDGAPDGVILIGDDGGDFQRRHAQSRLEQRFGPLLLQSLDRCFDLTFVERDHDIAFRIDALGDFQPEVQRDQRSVLALEIEQLGPLASAELDDVAKTPRRDEGAARAFPFQRRVGPARRAVHEPDDGSQIDLRRVEPVDEAGGLVPGVEGTLLIMTAPASSTTIVSVKVPPTSTPTCKAPEAGRRRTDSCTGLSLCENIFTPRMLTEWRMLSRLSKP